MIVGVGEWAWGVRSHLGVWVEARVGVGVETDKLCELAATRTLAH